MTAWTLIYANSIKVFCKSKLIYKTIWVKKRDNYKKSIGIYFANQKEEPQAWLAAPFR